MGDKIRAQGTSRVILGVRSAVITPLITLLTKSHEPSNGTLSRRKHARRTSPEQKPRGSTNTPIMELGSQNHSRDGRLGPNSIIVVYMEPLGNSRIPSLRTAQP